MPVKTEEQPETSSSLLLNRRMADFGRKWEMDERQSLRSDLKRYRNLRELTYDERALAAIEKLIMEAETRLAQIESGRSKGAARSCWAVFLRACREGGLRARL